jgi:hypothetical protein
LERLVGLVPQAGRDRLDCLVWMLFFALIRLSYIAQVFWAMQGQLNSAATFWAHTAMAANWF